MAKTIELTLDWKGPYTTTDLIPDNAGLYVILSGKQNEKGTWPTNLYKLLDIGQAGGIKTRLDDHDRADCWALKKTKDHTIVYKYALMPTKTFDQSDRLSVECCLRSKKTPPCGEECNKGYSRDDTVKITNEGNPAPLAKSYTCKP